MVSERASRIWNSHPGYPEPTIRLRGGDCTTFHKRLATDKVFHATKVTPKNHRFPWARIGEVKHSLHPSTKTSTAEEDLLTVAIDDFGAGYSEVRSHGTRRPLSFKNRRMTALHDHHRVRIEPAKFRNAAVEHNPEKQNPKGILP